MAPDNVEILREGFEDFRRTHEPVAELFAPDFIWDMSTFTGWPEKQAYHGLEGVAEFFDNWIGSFDDWDFEIEEIVEARDGEVVVTMRQYGTSKLTGARVDMRLAQIWTMRDGKALRQQMYDDPAEARAAAGLAQ